MTRPLVYVTFLACAAFLPLHAQTAPVATTSLDSAWKPVKWRSIGPFRGGRSVAASGVVGNDKTWYMGTTGGGLWKSENMGISWKNVSDGFFKTGTIGAIAVAESDPNVVYVGTGEHAIRGVMTHSGDGVYRSTDAGKTWKTHRTRLHPAHLPHRRPPEESGCRPRRRAGHALRPVKTNAASSSPPTAA